MVELSDRVVAFQFISASANHLRRSFQAIQINSYVHLKMIFRLCNDSTRTNLSEESEKDVHRIFQVPTDFGTNGR
ncbi:hypothetical protein T01_5288 [Trichinella spiralis]|uniref:Uncharacterized protein n=1 Tax=Trichinella spiralis TaxID=6334 RepID=A0A0V1BKM3_TRISP|nr:hypothetical protein T01_5288 [Trichinella spiralis]